MTENKLSFGFIGVGQAGNKIVDCFAEDFPVIAVNTAKQDLDALKNVPEDRRIFTQINAGGGAGKEIELGNQAIKEYQEKIADTIDTVFKHEEVDYIFTVGGLGGGSGTLGLTQVSRILARMGRKQGIIATLPTSSEGTYEQINAHAGLYMIEQARERFNNTLKSIVLIDNEELKRAVLEDDEREVIYEEIYDAMNDEIKSAFTDLYEFSQEAGDDNLDTNDLKKLFDIKGYMIFNKGVMQLEDRSDTSLIQETKELWDSQTYVAGDIKKALGAGVVINRPSTMKDGRKIDQFFSEMKDYFGAVHFASGIYSTQGKMKKLIEQLGSDKPVEVYTLLSGLPFPESKAKELEERARKEKEELDSKRVESSMEFDRELLDGIAGSEVEADEDVDDFDLFTDDSGNEEMEDEDIINEEEELDWSKYNI